MIRHDYRWIFLLLLLFASTAVRTADRQSTLVLDNFDRLNVKTTDSGTVWYGFGNIRLRLDSTVITSDSMIWYKDHDVIHFIGSVQARDSAREIAAGRISYYHRDSVLVAIDSVVTVNRLDSVKTESQRAEFVRGGNVVHLTGSPRMYLNYPDPANIVEVTAVSLTFFSDAKQGEAQDSVVITKGNVRATCQCAEFFQKESLLTLTGNPRAVEDSSEIKGDLMYIRFRKGGIDRIEVFENAEGLFVEQPGSTSEEFSGESRLTGKDMTFFFQQDEIRRISAVGAARSEYSPSPDDTTGTGKNLVSGDSIFVYVAERRITKMEVKGGAEGIYITPRDTAADSAAAVNADSANTRATSAATPPADSVVAGPVDTVAVRDSLPMAAVPEDSILYRGSFLEFFADQQIIRMTGNSFVRQGSVTLEADQIDYDVPKRVVLARAATDTSDSARPFKPLALKDGGEELFGSKLVFNVDTKKGKMENATTQYERAYYRGKDLYKEDEKVFYVENGRLSSCNLEEPHFHFRSHRMKLIHDDRVIARPVTLYIETLPVLKIPYYVFPLKRGRHSGILPIKLGNFERGRRFLGNLGYYWAASEYWDLQGALDFYENIGISINGQLRYYRRYAYSGNVMASYARDRQEQARTVIKRDRWRVKGDHAQMLPYEVDFRASGEFVSDKNYSKDFLADPYEARNRIIISKANFNKRFGGSSLSLSFSHTNNLDTEARNSTLPTGSFTMPSFQPFGSGRTVDGKIIKKWYNSFYLGYRNGFSVSTDRRKSGDTLITRKEYAYIDHSISITSSQTLLKYITIGPSVSLSETWYYVMKTDQSEAAGIIPDRPYRRGAISANVSSRTDLYGTFPINVLGLVALRHVFSPSVGFGWSPAVTQNDAVRKYVGRGGGGLKQESLSFSVQNRFQAKIKKGETEEQLDLLRVSSSLNYNFQAISRKFSDLSTSLSSNILRNITLQGALTHDLYDKGNKLRWKSPSLKSFSFSSSFQAKGSVADDYTRQGLSAGATDTVVSSTLSGLSTELPTPTAGGSETGAAAGWNLNVSYSYSESRSYGATTYRTHWLQVTFSLDLTRNWKLRYAQKYDFVRHESVDKIVDLYRSMHCWEGHFYWIPNGSRQGYYFKINVIAIPDIKLEKSESGLRGALFNR